MQIGRDAKIFPAYIDNALWLGGRDQATGRVDSEENSRRGTSCRLEAGLGAAAARRKGVRACANRGA